ncbi:MAG: ribosomal RNA small subunit methyltransferase A [Erysipelotrichaceae bacterium]|nr:ribosomal RNA small subunit methyltransferase A [Erysipelotrichaceae bacterium]
MEINRSNINDIIKKLNLFPDKDYGQNFLIDSLLANRIVNELKIDGNDTILEIGPGLGSLTHFLLLPKVNIDVVDIDSRMTLFLNRAYADCPHLKIINDDIRNIDVSHYSKIIGNLPYNITTELITYLVMNATNCHQYLLMCQAEAFSRFSDMTGKNYGPISVLIHLLGNSKKILTVKPGSFYPSPKCNSVVFNITINNVMNRKDYLSTYLLCKQLFLNRRKTILNNLTSYLKDRNLAQKVCFDAHIECDRRPEQICPKEYFDLYQVLSANGNMK